MAESKITIEKFKDIFLHAVTTSDGKYTEYTSNSIFTFCVKNAMMNLAEECGADYQPEYYSVDHTFWADFSAENKANADKVHMSNWKWNLLALIEHENDPNDWNYEVIKLAPFHCPLRVVIGYRNTKVDDEARLQYVCGLLRSMKENACFCEDGDFWIVIGNCGHGDADYVFYKYDCDEGRFERKAV